MKTSRKGLTLELRNKLGSVQTIFEGKIALVPVYMEVGDPR